jgi:hypothetical protein
LAPFKQGEKTCTEETDGSGPPPLMITVRTFEELRGRLDYKLK